MYDYTKNTLEELPEEWLSGGSGTTAANLRFLVDPSSEKLSKKDTLFSHHNVAKLVFLSKRARPNTQPTIEFLCNRVRKLDTDDAKKLVQLTIYLKETLYLPLTLEADDGINVVKWWINSSYGVHSDIQIYIGATMTLGKGSIYSCSSTQKINTKAQLRVN